MFCSSAVTEFKRLTAYERGRPGYVIDQLVPLALGGADTPANMQWQTIQAAANRSVFNVEVSRDGVTREHKYRFETASSLQYPRFHEHGDAVWVEVT